MSIAEEYATQMIGIGEYDEKRWNHNDKMLFHTIVKAVKYGQSQPPQRPSMEWVKASFEKLIDIAERYRKSTGETGVGNHLTNEIKEMLAHIETGESNESLREALENLLQLKDWKDKHGKDEHYEKHQPLAWEAARKALNEYLKHKTEVK